MSLKSDMYWPLKRDKEGCLSRSLAVYAAAKAVGCLLTRCLVPVCHVCGGGQGFVCDLLLDQWFTPLEISLLACKGLSEIFLS